MPCHVFSPVYTQEKLQLHKRLHINSAINEVLKVVFVVMLRGLKSIVQQCYKDILAVTTVIVWASTVSDQSTITSKQFQELRLEMYVHSSRTWMSRQNRAFSDFVDVLFFCGKMTVQYTSIISRERKKNKNNNLVQKFFILGLIADLMFG